MDALVLYELKQLVNMMLRRKDIEECLIYRGYYHTPFSTRLVISEDGKVIDLVMNVSILPRLTGMGYLIIDVNGEGSYLLHRLLAFTFLHSFDTINVLVVNHKDGNKLNNDLINLELCTYSENSLHAYKTGLRTDNTPIVCKDLRDDSLLEFYSLQECARYFERNGEAIYRYLNSGKTTPFMLYYSLERKGENGCRLSKADIGKVPNGAPKSIIVEDVTTNVLTLYPSAGAVSRHFGIDQATLSKLLNTEIESKTPSYGKLFHFRDLFTTADRIVVDSGVTLPKPTPPKRKPLPIWVTNVHTEEKIHYDSVEQFASDYHTSKNTVQKSMLLKDGRWKHFNIRYVSNKVLPTSNSDVVLL